MFREMRRKDRKLENAEMVELLKKGEYGILSLRDENDYAYGIPISYVYVNNSIYFHSALEGKKIDAIARNSRVSFCVVGNTMMLPDKFSTNYESVIAFGKAVNVSGTEKEKALFALVDKYSSQYKEQGQEYIKKASERTKVFKIDIEYSSGKARK